MKILYTNFHGGNGGGHVTYIINLAKALSKDHQITIAAPATSRLYRYAKAIPGVTVEDMQYTTRPSSWFKDRAQLRRLIKAGGFDIIHANGSADHKQVMLATLGMRRRPRIVFTKHNDHPLASLGHKLRVALATDHAIAVSDYVHGLMQQSPYGKRPITTIRHGIDTNFFAPPPPESLDKLRAIFFGPDWQGKLLLGSAGGTDYDKGWLDLVAAVAALPPEDRKRVLLMVAGDPPNEAKLARVRELGMIDQVRFPGLLDDVRAALASCHAGFVLSYREALSFACREIMGLGLPALVSDAGGLPENVTDGVDGWIVPARDVPAITAKLRFMLDHPDAVRAMGAQARETSLRDFNLERFAAATLDVYRRALG
ncbi:glycosyltransferase [Achromobacter sp. ACM04]|uniref:glycosyltransferase n=1 Tax=Achromobacter TaxID=222 RepID=UPI000D44B146|nr:glycosyltransferase [Achromobacter aegrifaciens]MBD9384409.1 glycosyltransferase [Achromobacter sp. ACM02]MBD9421897.1 glycosyltransferase [Achromobacter sp. ACM04]PTN42502.1 transferase [Achromobacter xylosoxidans]MDQ1762812.1 glycosyltransferase [Achromobacter aegrifaciens]RSE92344.1 glycosyltransferase family 1 protein [Achromobacter aegrifaciens]